MAVFGERLLEVLAAMLLTGAIFVAYNGVANGIWDYGMLLIVPLSFMLSMALAAMAAANIAMGLFLLLLGLRGEGQSHHPLEEPVQQVRGDLVVDRRGAHAALGVDRRDAVAGSNQHLGTR